MSFNQLPYEILLNICDILGYNSYTRTVLYLNDILNLNISDKKIKMYLAYALFNSRENYNYKIDYTSRMLALYYKSGIDDGISRENLLKINYKKYPFLYRTIFSHDIIKYNNINAVCYRDINGKLNDINHYVYQFTNKYILKHNFKHNYLYSIIPDYRKRPIKTTIAMVQSNQAHNNINYFIHYVNIKMLECNFNNFQNYVTNYYKYLNIDYRL